MKKSGLMAAVILASFSGAAFAEGGNLYAACEFRFKLDTHSTANWTAIPEQTGH